MLVLSRIVTGIDAASDAIGRFFAWLTLGSVLVCFLVVILRYFFSIGFPWMQELYVWEHACVFMLGAGYTMLHQGHVNVDILYHRWSPRTRAWVDILCVLIFLFPWLGVVAWASSQFILSSWSIRETSPIADGMPGLFLFKTTIWIFCGLLFLQGLSLIGHKVLFLRGFDSSGTTFTSKPQ